jgi:phosphatidylethanolamine-binding protein (PEBP) family uncharacterized protein
LGDSADGDNVKKGDNQLKGGFRFGDNWSHSIYVAPNPLPGHGVHRYFYQVVGLDAAFDPASLSSRPTKGELAKKIVGHVAGWGVWIEVAERK